MDKKGECEIVKDLLYSYNERMLSDKSNEFVTNHLKNCNECQKRLEMLKSNIFNQEIVEKQEDEIELRHLRKVNRHIRKLKIILIVIIGIIFLTIGGVFLKSRYNGYIIDNTYHKLEELKKSDNYKLVRKIVDVDHQNNESYSLTSTCFYKDGKYKETYDNTSCYYIDNSSERAYIFNDLKTIEYFNNYLPTKKGEYFSLFTEITNIYKYETNIFQKASLTVRKEKYNEVDCYVIREKGNKNGYRDIWINKKDFTIVRVVDDFDSYYRETVYSLTVNETLDSDIIMEDTSKYIGYTVKDERNNNEVINND